MKIPLFAAALILCLLSGSAFAGSQAFVGAYEISDPYVQFVQPPASFGSLNPATGRRGAFHQVPAIADAADGATLFLGLNAPNVTSLGVMNAQTGAVTVLDIKYNTAGFVSGN